MGVHSLLRCVEEFEAEAPNAAAPNVRPRVVLTHLIIPGLLPLSLALGLLHRFQLSQTFLGLAEQAKDGVGLCARWASSQLLRGAEDLVKELQ